MPVPILMDWVVIAAYAFAATLCFLSWRQDDFVLKKQSRIWLLLATSVLLLGINKFLYFENCITKGFSAIARSEGWYGERRAMQAIFVCAIISLLICAIVGVNYLLKNVERSLQSALVAFVILLMLVILRTVSLHQIDALIFPDALGIGIGINWIIELTCNLWIAISAYYYYSKHN